MKGIEPLASSNIFPNEESYLISNVDEISKMLAENVRYSEFGIPLDHIPGMGVVARFCNYISVAEVHQGTWSVEPGYNEQRPCHYIDIRWDIFHIHMESALTRY